MFCISLFKYKSLPSSRFLSVENTYMCICYIWNIINIASVLGGRFTEMKIVCHIWFWSWNKKIVSLRPAWTTWWDSVTKQDKPKQNEWMGVRREKTRMYKVVLQALLLYTQTAISSVYKLHIILKWLLGI